MDSNLVAARAPTIEALTPYDRVHFVTYARLLDTAGDWRAVSRAVLGLDVDAGEVAAWHCYLSHLERARWIERQGIGLVLADLQRE